MSKREIEEANNEISEPENTISDNQLTKKIKLQHEKILLKIKETNEEIDIDEHGVYKFLLIFNTIFETINSQESPEETDGFVTDAILQIVNVIRPRLKNNMDGLKVSEIVKTALKTVKSLFVLKEKDKEESKTGEPEPENTELSERPRRPMRPAVRGEKNNDRIRVRNKRYKIKRFILQPRNINVTHNGRVLKGW